MALRDIVVDGNAVLRKRCREVEVFDDKLAKLLDDMKDTLKKADGVGLAAPQVGILKRIIVIDLYEEGTQFTLINPVIINEKGCQEVEEGCLSFPNKFGKVERPKEIVVEALNLEGKKIKVKAKDLLAQALSHEIDHLNGVVFTEKILPGTLEVVSDEDIKKAKENKK